VKTSNLIIGFRFVQTEWVVAVGIFFNIAQQEKSMLMKNPTSVEAIVLLK
jgi:hypothetical protein